MLLASAAVCGQNAAAQMSGSVRFGITGGLNSSAAKASDFDVKSVSQYHAGVFAQIPVAAGFAVQPAITYSVKGATLGSMLESPIDEDIKSLDTKVGYIEVPIQIQWGPDLLAFRPYVFAEPFIGYGLNTENESLRFNGTKESIKEFADSTLQRLEYGLGVGGGLEFWRFQLSAKYFWNFGQLYNGEDAPKANDIAATVKEAFSGNRNFNGIVVSLSIFL